MEWQEKDKRKGDQKDKCTKDEKGKAKSWLPV